jgi:hypothetical protein
MIHELGWSKAKKSKVLKRKESKESFSFYASEASDSLQPMPSSSFLKFLDTDSENLRPGRIPNTPYSENFYSAYCFLDKTHKRRDNREARLNKISEKYVCDVWAQNLKMVPVKHEYKTAGGDGSLSGKQHQDSVNSAKPVPPFPFREEDLLMNENDKQRLIDIWDWTKSSGSRKKRNVLVDQSCDVYKVILDEYDEIWRC